MDKEKTTRQRLAEWGAEHRGSSEIQKDLDEAAEKYQDDHTIQRYAGGRLLAPEFDVTIKEVFIAGAKCQKEQMMKEAVEGEVCGRVYDHINVRFADGVCKFLEPKNISHIPADVSKYKIGDKVRIIIVKEGEK